MIAQWLGIGANAATIAGVTGVFFAWVSFTHTRDTNRASHMNSLFRDMLRLEFDFYNATEPRSENSDAFRSLFSYKMWVLEEIWMWVDGQRWRPFLLQPQRKAAHDRLLRGWRDTLIYHLQRKASERGWRDFINNQGCYHPGFVKFARTYHPFSPDYRRLASTLDCPDCGQTVIAEPEWLSECMPARQPRQH